LQFGGGEAMGALLSFAESCKLKANHIRLIIMYIFFILFLYN